MWFKRFRMGELHVSLGGLNVLLDELNVFIWGFRKKKIEKERV